MDATPTHPVRVSPLFVAAATTRDECWPWPGRLDRDGYPHVKDGGRRRLAHRVAYELAYGAIPEMMTVDHVCKNRSCVNPAHLQLLSWAENCGPTRFGTRRWYEMAGFVHKHELARRPDAEPAGEPF